VDDPFGTAALRTAVLDAWAASPTRFREDANAEEDLRLGGYADTWFVELAQNAADAAGGAGRLRITLVDDAAGGARPAAVGGVAGRPPAETRPGDGGEAGSGSAAAAGAESDVGIPAAGLEQAARAVGADSGQARGAVGAQSDAGQAGAPAAALESAAEAVGADSGQTFGAVAAGRAELRVANTGAPLTAAGVAALASLRASAKRDEAGAVGRFGVGFAAVLAVSAEPRVVSTSGAVAFSADRTAAAIADLPGPAAELARRDAPPVLRLVWPSAEHPPDGFATEVRLPLRAGVDGAALLAHARSAASDLLLALPALVEIDVDGHVVRRAERDGVVAIGPQRWHLVRRAGVLEVADAAVEQRDRQEWSVTWALPLSGPLGDDVAHAPTATAEALALPARLIATLPLEPDRRRVRLGPVTDAVLDGAAAAYVDLVRSVVPDERLALVPPPDFPRSRLDGELRARIVAALRAAAWLPAASPPTEPGAAGSDAGAPAAAELDEGAAPAAGWEQGGAPAAARLHEDAPQAGWEQGASAQRGRPGAVRELSPGRAEWLDIPGLGPRLPGLLATAGFDDLAAPPYLPVALTELGARRVTPTELVERLFGIDRPPSWWRALYAELGELADVVPGLVDELRALPVPLVDGRAAAGPATVLLPEGPLPAGLGVPGLHVAHPDAVHPLLARLGASPADPAALLEHPALQAAVERSVEDAEAGLDTAPLAEAVLALLAAGAPAGEELAALALPDADGEPARADELMLPDAALRPLLADDVPVAVLHPEWAARFPREVLTAVGVLDGFAVVVDEEPVGPDHDLDDEDRWWDGLAAPPTRLVAVRDLDLVDDTAWPAALALLAADRDTREAAMTGYTAWWLARHARLGGRRPGHWRLPTADALAALYDPAPPALAPTPTPTPTCQECHPADTGCPQCHPADTTGGGPTTPPRRPSGAAPLARPPDDAFLAAIGVRRDLHVADARAADDLLARLADPHRHPSAALVAAAHVALAEAVADGRVAAADLDLPEHVRAMDGAVVHVDVAAVLDAPWPAAVLPAGELVIGGDPVALAELLDLPLATEIVAGRVEQAGVPVAWADIGEVVVTCHTLGVDVPDGGLRRHDELWVDLHRPTNGRHRVPVWREPDDTWHAEDPLRALLALLAG